MKNFNATLFSMKFFKESGLVIATACTIVIGLFITIAPLRNQVASSTLQAAVASGLSESQIQSVINLMRAFGIDENVIGDVDDILHDRNHVATTTGQ